MMMMMMMRTFTFTLMMMITFIICFLVLGTISLEFINYGLALLVYAVRYPSVFWNTNKWFGTLFSFQLIGNMLQNLLSFSGMSILYKIQVSFFFL